VGSNGGETVDCTVCGFADADLWTWVHESDDPQAAPAMRGDRSFPVVRCKECGLAYISPRYTTDELRQLYADENLFKGSTDPEGQRRSYLGEKESKQRTFIELVRWLERYKLGGTLLDVGCGPGFFLDILGEQWRGQGIDWSSFAVQYAQRVLGLDVMHGSFDTEQYAADSFDAVVMLQVLDHLSDPRQALLETQRILKPGGMLMLTSLINGNSYCARLFAGGYRLLAPNHLYYFSPRTLKLLLQESGYRIEKVRFPYWNTPYCNYREIKNLSYRSLQVACARLLGRPTKVLSPPFYGNHFDVMAQKLL